MASKSNRKKSKIIKSSNKTIEVPRIQPQQPQSKNESKAIIFSLTIIICLIFIAMLTSLVFLNLNKKTPKGKNDEVTNTSTNVTINENPTIQSNKDLNIKNEEEKEVNKNEGSIDKGITTTNNNILNVINTSQELPNFNGEIAGTYISHEWMVNDYKKGEIPEANYMVKTGDTLWEIAEGMYGDGFRWKEILEKNYLEIGLLETGEQALIIPGQVLTV